MVSLSTGRTGEDGVWSVYPLTGQVRMGCGQSKHIEGALSSECGSEQRLCTDPRQLL